MISFNSIYGQQKDDIFRISGSTKNTNGYLYNVDILILKKDHTYELLKQEYLSKKFVKKNIPFSAYKEKGNWFRSQDTLKLIDGKSQKERWFLYLNRKRLIKLINKKEKSQKAWNKINY